MSGGQADGRPYDAPTGSARGAASDDTEGPFAVGSGDLGEDREHPTLLLLHGFGAHEGDLAALAGDDRQAVVARELTKLHEELRTGSLRELGEYYSSKDPRGEITVVLAGTGVLALGADVSGDTGDWGSAAAADGPLPGADKN